MAVQGSAQSVLGGGAVATGRKMRFPDRMTIIRSRAGFFLVIALTVAAPAEASRSPEPPPISFAPPGAEIAPDAPPPSSSRSMPPLETIALPEEQPTAAALFRALAGVKQGDSKTLLVVLDGALADLPKPTMLRGLVQLYRAMAFETLRRSGEALAAAEEAIRLLPDYSAPLMMASEIHLYSNNPGLAADEFLRAAEIDPDAARSVSDYDLSSLMHRLDALGDRKRAQRLGDRMLDLGWTGEGLHSRTNLARAAIERAVEDGDLPRARRLVPSLLDPGASYKLLTLNMYKPIWPDIEAWAGPKLATQWRMYLDEARRRWAAGGDIERGQDYAEALAEAGAYDRLIAEFLPVFDAPHKADEDWAMLFIAPKLASALVIRGRVADAMAMYDHADKIWPLGSSANALNLVANRASALLTVDRPAEALKQIDLAIADTHRWGSEINSDAIAGMHAVRACALKALGRGSEAVISGAIAAQAGRAILALNVAVCMGDQAAARTALLKAITRPEERPGIALFLQPDGQALPQAAYAQAQRNAADALRHDPQILAAFAAYGRVLDYASNAGAPKQ